MSTPSRSDPARRLQVVPDAAQAERCRVWSIYETDAVAAGGLSIPCLGPKGHSGRHSFNGTWDDEPQGDSRG